MQVVSPGLQTTVQDLGRRGYGPEGVSASGAADPASLRIGNRLLGNSEAAAALEMTLLGGTYQFPDGVEILTAGSDFGAALDGVRIPLWTRTVVRAGQTLRIGHTQTGARCYLCVHGGFQVPLFYGSASTHLLSGLGGFEGRALRKGDLLSIADPCRNSSEVGLDPGRLMKLIPDRTRMENGVVTLRVSTGPQADWFSAETFGSFLADPYQVTEEANRMGLRLQGPPLEAQVDRQMISEGIALGAVQVPSGGQPIILGVEQQTAGGYPKIANVISADLASLGQLRPRDEVRFELVSIERALALWRDQESLFASGGWIES
ncbi:MAG: biotin-dependent carboxyltransferase family protein [Bryobacteraceae bacterium]